MKAWAETIPAVALKMGAGVQGIVGRKGNLEAGVSWQMWLIILGQILSHLALTVHLMSV